MTYWPKYESHKIVSAAEIVGFSIDDPTIVMVDPGDGLIEAFQPTEVAMVARAEVGGYAVLYAEGFKSISPKKAFEDGYTRVP